jgi:RimJ/RimL family protein N-acetyltransferase
MTRLNEFGQPIGNAVPGWAPRPLPPRTPMTGRLVRLEALDAHKHAGALHAQYARDADARHWTYLPYGPFDSEAAYRAWVSEAQVKNDPLFYAIADVATGKPTGVAAYLRIDAPMGVIEVGHLRFGPALQRTAASTEAMYLMMRRAFDEFGYRRYEWKCDALNAPSVAAAKRLGFTFEGIFRQAIVVKGRNRDTAWLSITDKEWPAIKAGFEAWLDPSNFASDGRQRRRLEELMQLAKTKPGG